MAAPTRLPSGKAAPEACAGQSAGTGPAATFRRGAHNTPAVRLACRCLVSFVRRTSRHACRRILRDACLAIAVLAGLQPDVGRAQQGAPAPLWERKFDRWSVALLPGGMRCAMFGATHDDSHRVQIAANRQGQPYAFVELIGPAGGEHVSLQPELEIRLWADDRAWQLRVSSTFRASVIATFVTPFDPILARAAKVEIDTGHPMRLQLDMKGLARAGVAMADCLAGRVPAPASFGSCSDADVPLRCRQPRPRGSADKIRGNR